MGLAQRKGEHFYISKTKGVCGGRACVVGVRVPVWLIVERVYRLGQTPEECLQIWPDLNLAKIHDALSYYFDHPAEIDKDLADHSEETLKRELPELFQHA